MDIASGAKFMRCTHCRNVEPGRLAGYPHPFLAPADDRACAEQPVALFHCLVCGSAWIRRYGEDGVIGWQLRPEA